MTKKCKTPGIWFCFSTETQRLINLPTVCKGQFMFSLPGDIILTKARARRLEKALHDTTESVLASLFKKKPK